MKKTFNNATSFTGDISGWQTLISYMEYTFAGTNSFNVDLNSWDVTKVSKYELWNGAS